MSEHVESKLAKLSEMVVDAQTSCRILMSAVNEDGPEVVKILEKDIRDAIEASGDDPPKVESPVGAVQSTLDGLSALLGHRLGRLLTTDQALFGAHARGATAR